MHLCRTIHYTTTIYNSLCMVPWYSYCYGNTVTQYKYTGTHTHMRAHIHTFKGSVAENTIRI